jgi:hypothetical protein
VKTLSSAADGFDVATAACHELILPQLGKPRRTILRSKLKMVRSKLKMVRSKRKMVRTKRKMVTGTCNFLAP